MFEKLSFNDAMTGLFNRNYLVMHPDDVKRKLPCSYVMFDLNHLKEINDNYGHSKGDEYIRNFAEILKKILPENAEAIRADNVAFDLLWRKFYGDYEQMRPTVGQLVQEKNTDDNDSPYRSSSLASPPSYAYREYVTPFNNGKILAVTLRYGPEGQYTISNEIFRCNIPRTSN